MAKFSDIAKGRRARKPVPFDCGLDEPVIVDVRVLLPDEEADVLAGARAFVVSKGIPNATEDDPAFRIGVMAHRLFRACIDHDSPEDKPEPFFSSVEQILTSEQLNRTNILALFNEQEMWQEQVAEQPLTLTEDGLEKLITSCAEDDPFPFASLRPLKQWAFVRTLALLLASSVRDKSLSTFASSPESNDDERKSGSNSEPKTS